MPRRRRLRKIVSPPGFSGFKPYGIWMDDKNPVELLYEEYEAIKLADYKMMNHEEAAQLMGVSRATFARIYDAARKKVAKALVESRELKSVYGNAWMDKSWYYCNDCHARFSMPEKNVNNKCGLCKSTSVQRINVNE
jgi:predicted DNA-binding protein (UPF0251 family)